MKQVVKESSSSLTQSPTPDQHSLKTQAKKYAEYKPSFDWKHKPEVLLYESAQYPTQVCSTVRNIRC